MDAPAPVPASPADLEELRAAARGCRACPLWEPATQTVFGEGPPDAALALVGEQPGDVEDRAGRPFVGPAGTLMNRALSDAGIARDECYVTNAVKHFRFTQAAPGKRRIHQRPEALHVAACRPWLSAELNLVRPRLVVLLGATAAASLLGPTFRVTRSRGRLLAGPPGSGALLLATVHPSAVLRTPPESRDQAYRDLVADLGVAARALAAEAHPPAAGARPGISRAGSRSAPPPHR